uniref:Exocyst subunit Exo70 family protein n=1 Tax=Davidia involucrata TaxID=16924 RepID=A0A5B7BP20_DAVIN
MIVSYKKTLTQLTKSPKEEDMRHFNDQTGTYMEFAELERRTPLAVHLIWIIYILQFKLECKSKHYEDPSLAQLFMINNFHCIVQKIEESPVLLEMIGDYYVEKLTENVRQAVIRYQKSTWDRIFHCLTADEGGVDKSGFFSSRVSKRALGERVKSFNAMFEEVHQTQATWFVPDLQLREDIRLSILEVLIPAYRSFLGQLDSHIGRGKQREEFIKYSVEDLETLVSSLFEGCPYTTTLRSQ